MLCAWVDTRGGAAIRTTTSATTRRHISLEVGEGHHRFKYEGCLLEATVSIHASETVKEIIKREEYCTTHVAKQISITGIRDAEQMKRLLSDASKHATSILRQDKEKRRASTRVGRSGPS